jgi:hypothetical protein
VVTSGVGPRPGGKPVYAGNSMNSLTSALAVTRCLLGAGVALQPLTCAVTCVPRLDLWRACILCSFCSLVCPASEYRLEMV